MRPAVLEEGGKGMLGVMIQGTSSDVGKSFICTALCRAFARRGLSVAPFKSQNMSNNSYVTKEGAEIGRAQGIQAEAAGVEASVMMNPILLKPRNDHTSEVIRFGRVHQTLSGKDYRRQFYELGLETIREALATLEAEYDAIVIEGAGSPVEMNLNDRELVNMKVAELADVPVILVADIDRGGIFASIAGTLQLLSAQERSRVIGVVVNKFRGDPELFVSGRKWIEENLGVEVLAVLPYLDHHRIEAEDSLSRQTRYRQAVKRHDQLEIVMIDLPYLSNDTDLEPFLHEPDVSLRLVGMHDQLGCPDAVLLPGTKSTIRDLEAMMATGLSEQLKAYVRQGGTVIGICGGYQMLGQTIIDEAGTDTGTAGLKVKGLGILPVETVFAQEKWTSQSVGKLVAPQFEALAPLTGFEIHLGHSRQLTESALPFLTVAEREDGIFAEEGRLIGSYFHHLFYNDQWRTWWLNRLRKNRSLPEQPVRSLQSERQKGYEQAADWLEAELDVRRLLDKIEAWRKSDAPH